MAARKGKAKFRVGQVVVDKEWPSAMNKIRSRYMAQGGQAYELRNGGMRMETELRSLTRREKGD